MWLALVVAALALASPNYDAEADYEYGYGYEEGDHGSEGDYGGRYDEGDYEGYRPDGDDDTVVTTTTTPSIPTTLPPHKTCAMLKAEGKLDCTGWNIGPKLGNCCAKDCPPHNNIVPLEWPVWDYDEARDICVKITAGDKTLYNLGFASKETCRVKCRPHHTPGPVLPRPVPQCSPNEELCTTQIGTQICAVKDANGHACETI